MKILKNEKQSENTSLLIMAYHLSRQLQIEKEN